MLALLAVLAAAPGGVLERNECFRCHVYVAAEAHSDELECAGCHRRLSSGGMDEKKGSFDAKVWRRFKERTAQHFTRVPPLIGLSRLRTSWLKAFLAAPYDLRPHLSETMIRNALTVEDVAALAALWKTQADEAAPPRPEPKRLAEARELFVASGCPACHAAEKADVPGQLLAPDLRHARDRMNFSAVVAYVKDPHALNTATEMPDLKRSDADAQLLAEWVMFGDFGPPPARAEPKPLPYDTKAPVPRYEEVEARVFKAVCWHCHANPDFANGNGGPGMSGGFGFKARGLSFASFEEVMSGSRDDAGKRQSIFRKGKSGEPVLLEVLRARWHEEAGRAGPGGPYGMPLGLPGVSPEDYALVERWVKGGRPPPAPGSSAGGPASPNLADPPKPRSFEDTLLEY